MTARPRLETRIARCFALKDYKRALPHLRELLEHVGENPQTLYMMAQCHERLAELEPALAYAERALRASPQHLEALQLVARIHVRREEHDKACESVRKGIEVIVNRHAVGAATPPSPSADRRPGPLRRWFDWSRWRRAGPKEPDHAQWLNWAEAYLRRHGDRHRDA